MSVHRIFVGTGNERRVDFLIENRAVYERSSDSRTFIRRKVTFGRKNSKIVRKEKHFFYRGVNRDFFFSDAFLSFSASVVVCPAFDMVFK